MRLPPTLDPAPSAVSLSRAAPEASQAMQKAMKELEARFAAALLDAALPRSKSMFGKGLAGSLARESLVNRIAQVVAEGGMLGLDRQPAEATRQARRSA